MDNTELNELLRIRKTVIELIEDRGFFVQDVIKNISEHDFKIMYENSNINIHIKYKDKEIYIYFDIGSKNFGKNDLKVQVNNIINLTENANVLILLILKDKPNSAILKELNNPKYNNTEIFERKNLLFNITKHILVPKHIILSEEEKNEVLKKFNANKEQLPKIYNTDPIAKYYGMKVGMVCKIIRKSKTTGQSIAYRTVSYKS